MPAPPADAIRTGWTLGLAADAPARRVAGATHTLRFGVDAEATALTSAIRARPTVAESVAGRAARVWQPTATDATSRRQLHAMSIFASDRVFAGPFASLDAGVRVDHVTGEAQGAVRGLAWTTVSPRLSLRLGGARASIFGGVGRYQAANPLSLLALAIPATLARREPLDRSSIATAGSTPAKTCSSSREPVGTPVVASIDAALRPPTSDEWTVGLEYRPTPLSVIRGAAIIRRQRDMVGSINTGVPRSAYRTFTIPDIGSDEGGPQDDQVLTDLQSRAGELRTGRVPLDQSQPGACGLRGPRVHLRAEHGAVVHAGGRHRVSRGRLGRQSGRGRARERPARHWRALRDAQCVGASSQPALRRSRVRREVVGRLSRPGRLHAWRASSATRTDNRSRASWCSICRRAQSSSRPMRSVARATRMRGRSMRVSRRGSRSDGRARRFALDVFNLSQHKNEVEEDVLTGPTFRRSTLVQPPDDRAGWGARGVLRSACRRSPHRGDGCVIAMASSRGRRLRAALSSFALVRDARNAAFPHSLPRG